MKLKSPRRGSEVFGGVESDQEWMDSLSEGDAYECWCEYKEDCAAMRRHLREFQDEKMSKRLASEEAKFNKLNEYLVAKGWAE